MNNHANIQKLLAAYSSNDLPEIDRLTVERHLRECPACRAQLSDLATALRLLRTMPEVEAPPWLTSRVMARLREEKAEKRSWFQRLMFPLHRAIPTQLLALLVVCVSGYYLSRSVETEIRQSGPQQLQEIPGQLPSAPAPAPTQLPAESKKAEQPTPAQPQKAAPPAAAPQPVPRRENLPDQRPPQPQSAPAPAEFAPAPPAVKERLGGKAETMKSAPSAESSNRAQEAAPEMKAKSGRSLKNMSDRAAPAGAVSGAAITPALPQGTVRMKVNDPITAAALIRQAVSRSGGAIYEEQGDARQHLKARIPASRQKELLERLLQLGSIMERPAAPAPGTQLLELTIQW